MRRALRWAILLAALPAVAADRLDVGVEAAAGEGWRIAGLQLSLDLTSDPLRGELRIRTIELPDAGLTFTDTAVTCGRVALSSRSFACHEATIAMDVPETGRQTFPGELAYARDSGALRFSLQAIRLAGGKLNVAGSATENAVEIEFAGEALQLAELGALASRFAPEIGDPGASGSVEVSGSLLARGGAISRVALRAELADASAANEAGTLVTDSAHATLEVRAARAAAGWTFAVGLAADAGEAYVEPVYANLSDTPVSVSAEGRFAGDPDEVALDSVSLRQGSEVAADGSLQLRLPSGDAGDVLVSGALELEDVSLDALYSGLLQVLAAGTLFGDLEMLGTLSGTVAFADNALTGADLVIEDLVADDRQGRFSVHRLNGAVHWPGPAGAPGDAPITTLSWQAASAYSIPFAAGSVSFRLGGNDVEMLEPLRVATMGGALLINRLSVTNFGEADASGLLDAELEPVQLGQLAAAFGWPAFSGTLSGRLPLLRYDGRVMTLGGAMTARAFDGDVELANLRLEEPFGRVPRLSGDLRLRRLDLERVTSTFSFGFIQGRLSGEVTGLELENWRPVAMDLHLYTPPDDDSRRRISQRAIENLASVGGGGAAAALSSGFMKFFEVFAYNEIGLRCVLRDGICTMSGAGPAGRDQAGGGYYIVRGSGLPRIDVVGYRSQVSWPSLLAQLERIMETGTAVQ